MDSKKEKSRKKSLLQEMFPDATTEYASCLETIKEKNKNIEKVLRMEECFSLVLDFCCPYYNEVEFFERYSEQPEKKITLMYYDKLRKKWERWNRKDEREKTRNHPAGLWISDIKGGRWTLQFDYSSSKLFLSDLMTRQSFLVLELPIFTVLDDMNFIPRVTQYWYSVGDTVKEKSLYFIMTRQWETRSASPTDIVIENKIERDKYKHEWSKREVIYELDLDTKTILAETVLDSSMFKDDYKKNFVSYELEQLGVTEQELLYSSTLRDVHAYCVGRNAHVYSSGRNKTYLMTPLNCFEFKNSQLALWKSNGNGWRENMYLNENENCFYSIRFVRHRFGATNQVMVSLESLSFDSSSSSSSYWTLVNQFQTSETEFNGVVRMDERIMYATRTFAKIVQKGLDVDAWYEIDIDFSKRLILLINTIKFI